MADLPSSKVAPVHPRKGRTHQVSEDRLKAFMEKTPLVAWVKDEDFRYQYVNKRFEKYFNLPPGKGIGMQDKDFVPPEVAEKLLANDLEAIKAGNPVEFVEHVPDASEDVRSWLVVKFPIPGTNGGTAVAGTAQEITERLQLEGENRLTGFALEHAGVAFYLLDSDAKIPSGQQSLLCPDRLCTRRARRGEHSETGSFRICKGLAQEVESLEGRRVPAV